MTRFLPAPRVARQHAARARVALAGASITAAAADPAKPLPAVLQVTEAHLRAVDGEHQALLDATAPPRPTLTHSGAAVRGVATGAGFEAVAGR